VFLIPRAAFNGRKATMSVTEPLGAWAVDLAEYHIRCVIQEKPQGTFTIAITENGVELLRETISGTGSAAWDWAQALRKSYEAYIRQKVHDEWHRQGSIW
jgi:hypothetical protein